MPSANFDSVHIFNKPREEISPDVPLGGPSSGGILYNLSSLGSALALSADHVDGKWLGINGRDSQTASPPFPYSQEHETNIPSFTSAKTASF